jgi:hypothetical protein
MRSHPLRTRKPLQSKRRSNRARPDEPLAVWCEVGVKGCEARAVHRHHKLPRSAGGTDDAANTADVCSHCHRYIHAHLTESYERGWMRKRTA